MGELMKHPVKHLSASSIQDWLDCPLLWHGRRVAKWPQAPSVELAMGKAMHAGFEAHHRGQDAETALMRAWEAEAVGDQAPPRYALHRAFDSLRAYREYNPRDRRDRPEVRFSFRVAGVPVPIIGVIDLLRSDELHEMKTGSRRWWTQKRVDESIQMSVYWLAFRSIFKHWPERGVYHIAPTQPVFLPPYPLETRRTEAQVADAEELIRRVWREMTGGELLAKCPAGRCRFAELCAPWRDDEPAIAVRSAAADDPGVDLAAGLA
jgi:putative RecB family exonuclease